MRTVGKGLGTTVLICAVLGPIGGIGETDAAAAGRKPYRQLAWPADDPRVRLEALVELDRLETRRAGRFLNRLTGRRVAASRFRRPYGVAWLGHDLLLTDPDSGRVVRIDAKGRIVASIGKPFLAPIGVSSCASGIAVTDSRAGRVAWLDADLRTVRWLADGLQRPTGVACSEDRLLVVETGRHRILDIDVPTGRHSRVFGSRGNGDGQFNFPTTIGFGPGSFWVGDTLNFRLQRFDSTTGEFVGSFGRLGDAAGEMPRLKGVAVDAGGRLWISDAFLDQVALFSGDGSFLMALGGTGSLPGEFSFPAGIAAHPDGRLAVVDSFNRRVQVFRALNDG